tara:strand:+ start:26460 stop:26588 length:129 start_codon:yes stop_codon:yes gene_type:complete
MNRWGALATGHGDLTKKPAFRYVVREIGRRRAERAACPDSAA